MSEIKLLANQLLAQNRRALAKAITLVESRKTEDREQALALLDIVMPHAGNATRIGISGSPGVGKSTFIEAYGQHLIANKHRIAALTIDPSSKLTGGSILGDKTRMPLLANNANAYIRPTPSGTLLGGVARRSREVIALCEAAGFDTILIETVGVGQSETNVADMVDFYMLLLQPGSGDTLQGIKRGIMELADMVVVNKADGVLLNAARESASHYLQALSLLQNKLADWSSPVVLCSSTEKTGFDDISDKIDDYLHIAKQNGHFELQRQKQCKLWLEDETIADLVEMFKHDVHISKQFEKTSAKLTQHASPARLASEFVKETLKR